MVDASLDANGLRTSSPGPGEPTASEEASAQLESAQLVWVLHGVGGLLALLGLVLAQRWGLRTIGRALVGGVGVALLIWLVVTGELTGRTILTLAVPGLLLIVAAIGLAPMPAPEET